MKPCRSWWVWLILLMAPGVQARTMHLYYTDPQGTVLTKTDAQGNILERYDYRPYGGIVGGTVPNGPGYTGHVNDPETAFVYMQARYDDPGAGRFLSPDPVGSSPGDLFGFNRYDYANNNPIVNTDPTGMCVGHHGVDDPCNPEPTLPSSKPKPVVPNPTSQSSNAKTLPTVTVTATALPIAAPISFGLGEVGGGLVIADPIPVIAVGALLYPTKMGAAPCEMAGGPPCGMMMSSAFPPGYWPGDSGAAEWGRRNGVGVKEGKDRFHRGVKEHTPGARGDHDFGVNPETGDVVDQNGEPVGNLNDEQ